ncbi:hypothetical protein ACWG5N_29340 [Streptomyces globisporus]
MSATVPTQTKPVCGARRPGWDQGPAVGINRIPCVLADGHEGEHRNAFHQTWADAPTAPTYEEIANLVADRITTDMPALDFDRAVFVTLVATGLRDVDQDALAATERGTR